MRTAKTLIRLGGLSGLSESSLGAHVILQVLSCPGSFINLFFPYSSLRMSSKYDSKSVHMCAIDIDFSQYFLRHYIACSLRLSMQGEFKTFQL